MTLFSIFYLDDKQPTRGFIVEEKKQGIKKKKLENKDESGLIEENENLFTVFDLEGEEYGISVNLMDEIVRDVEISRVPGSPDKVLGATNLRGEVIPVIDLKKTLSLGQSGDEVKETMIVEICDKKFAAPVDRLKDIISAKKDQLVDPSDITNLDDKRLQWIIKRENGRSIRIVNVQKIIENYIGDIDIK